MVSSKAKTVDEYLSSLPPEKQTVMRKVRDTLRKNVPKGFVEGMNWGMIVYEIPLSKYPDTYNKQPLGIAALAAQKNYFALYLWVYMDKKMDNWFRGEYKKRGLKLDMGKSCVRFKTLDELPLDVIAETVSKTSMNDYIQIFEKARGMMKK